MIRTLPEVVLPEEVLQEVRCPSIIMRCPGLTGWRGRSNGRQRGGSTATIMAETPKVGVTGNELFNFGNHYYRSRKKLLKGSIFSSVCLSVILYWMVGGGGSMWPLPMMYSTSLYSPQPLPHPPDIHGTLLYRDPKPKCPRPLPPDMGPQLPLSPASSGICWSKLEICLNFITCPPPVLTSGGYWSTYGWHKRAVCILLGCFLVTHCTHCFELLVTPGLISSFRVRWIS